MRDGCHRNCGLHSDLHQYFVAITAKQKPTAHINAEDTVECFPIPAAISCCDGDFIVDDISPADTACHVIYLVQTFLLREFIDYTCFLI